jgi:hypothetical protein
VYLFIEKPKEIIVKGIYFKGGYADVKFQKNKMYQAFVKNNKNIEFDIIFGETVKDKTEPELEEKIPFELINDEAVICYLEKEVLKYRKITLLKKDTFDVPM